jgi:MerR family transcriptional regulator, copper efflux regulator
VTVGSRGGGDPPIACNLEPSARPRQLADWQRVLGDVVARTRTSDGRLRVEFGAHIDPADLARLTAAEQRCCAFFSFNITIDARGVALEVGAPDGADEVVASLFGQPGD